LPLVLAVSFSNIQHYWGLPTYFVGLVFYSGSESSLPPFKTKDAFLNSNDLPTFDLFEVQSQLESLKKLIVVQKILALKKNEWSVLDRNYTLIINQYLNVYEKVIRQIFSSNFIVASQGLERCFFHVPLDYNGNELSVQKSLFSSHPIFKYPVAFLSKSTSNKFMQIARLVSWYKFLDKRRSSRRYINYYIRKNGEENHVQAIRMVWKSPQIEKYADAFVGFPNLIVRTNNGMNKIDLIPGSKIDILPIARFCLGPMAEFESNTLCLRSNEKKPFGTLLSPKGLDRCRDCSKRSLGIRCLYQKPKCDGSQVICGNEFFAGAICNGPFSVYVSIFNETLKVGKCIESRTVERLIEQSALDGLVFHPITSIMAAYIIEDKLSRYLKKNLKELRPYGIIKVTKNIRTELAFEQVKCLLKEDKSKEKKRREKVYNKVKYLVSKSVDPKVRILSAIESRIISFDRNWLIDENLELDRYNLIKDPHCQRIKGKIDGIIGSFIFVDGKVYDLGSLGGYVLRCH